MMRKIYIIALLLLTVSSCGIKTKIITEEIKDRTMEYDIYVKESFIDSRNGSTFRLIDPVNERLGVIIDSLVFQTKSEATDFFARIPIKKRPVWRYTLNSTDTIYRVTSKIVSAKVTAEIFSGGTHGVTKIFAVNYQPMKGKFISKEQLIDMKKKDKINKAISRNFTDSKGFTETPTVETATAINISKKSVIFTYEHYVLGPRSAGIAVIEVPIGELSGALLI